MLLESAQEKRCHEAQPDFARVGFRRESDEFLWAENPVREGNGAGMARPRGRLPNSLGKPNCLRRRERSSVVTELKCGVLYEVVVEQLISANIFTRN